LRPYAYINFDNEDDYDTAFNSQQKFKNRILYWVTPGVFHCTRCGSPDHETYNYTLRNNNNQSENKNTPVQYKPPQHNNTPVLDQTGLNRIMDSLSKLEQKFKTLSDDLTATKNISKELQQGQ
ncbi:1044_t:CDS:2, partial [Funneliformis geosporum]